MAVQPKLEKMFNNFRGLDKRSSDLTRPSDFASESQNARFRKDGSLSKRFGFQGVSNGKGGYGTTVYHNLNTSTGEIVEEIFSADENLYKLEEKSFKIIYTVAGDDNSAFYSIKANENNEIIFEFTEDTADTTTSYTFSLGTGLEASPPTIGSLKAWLDSFNKFTITISDSSINSDPAGLLPKAQSIDISKTVGSETKIKYKVYKEVPKWDTNYGNTSATPSSKPFTNGFAKKTVSAGDESLMENISFANVNGILYCSNGYDDLKKYDGNRIYNAGMKRPSDISEVGSHSGSKYYRYKIRYVQKDAKGRFTEGQASEPKLINHGIVDSGNDINLNIPTILNTEGFNTAYGKVNAQQTNVTNSLTIHSGHTLRIGDTAYFKDSTGEYHEKIITSVTGTTIGFDAMSSVTIEDNTVISNNLRIQIFRTADIGTGTDIPADVDLSYYLVEEIANDSSTANTSFVDNMSDINLVKKVAFEQPTIDAIGNYPLPKCKYMSTFGRLLVLAGDPSAVDKIYWSDPLQGPETFPQGVNFHSFPAGEGGRITSIAPLNKTLYVFQEKAIFSATGNMEDGSIRVDYVSSPSTGIGCTAHHTIKEVMGTLFFLNRKGIYSISTGAPPQEVSAIISPLFKEANKNFNFRRAVAANWNEQDSYILMLPVEEIQSNEYVSNTESELFVYDTYRQAWLQWTNMDLSGGIAVTTNGVFFSERSKGEISLNRNLYKIQNTGNTEDYADHAEPIDFKYTTHWETLGEPTVPKKFLRIKIHALDSLNDFESGIFSLSVKPERDFIDDNIADIIFDFSGLSSGGWGIPKWDTFSWGSSALSGKKSKLPSGKAKSFRLSFENSTVNENVLISGYELEIATPYNIGIKE